MVATKKCDGIEFVIPPGPNYAHPKKDTYGIDPRFFWGGEGNVFVHMMFDPIQSLGLALGGPPLIGAAIGAKIAYLPGAIVGAISGAIVGIGAFVMELTLDENGNLWVWIGRQFRDWLVASAPVLAFWSYVYPPVASLLFNSAFQRFGYIQIGGFDPIDFLGRGRVCV